MKHLNLQRVGTVHHIDNGIDTSAISFPHRPEPALDENNLKYDFFLCKIPPRLSPNVPKFYGDSPLCYLPHVEAHRWNHVLKPAFKHKKQIYSKFHTSLNWPEAITLTKVVFPACCKTKSHITARFLFLSCVVFKTKKSVAGPIDLKTNKCEFHFLFPEQGLQPGQEISQQLEAETC